MKPLALILLLFFALASCKKSKHNPSEEVLVDSISPVYFMNQMRVYATGTGISPYAAISKFHYSDNKVIKRSGGYVGFNYTDKIFDTVMYPSSSHISMSAKTSATSPLPPAYKWEIEMQNGLPKSRVSYVYHINDYEIGDTAFYYYNSKGLIERIESHSTVFGVSYLKKNEYFFDANNNLVKVTGVYLKKPNEIHYTTVETYSNYDNHKNLLKNLWMWDDLYCRAVSANNFAKYNYAKFDANNNPVEAAERTWTLQYDAKGNIIFK